MAIALNLDCIGLREARGAEKCDKYNKNGMMCLYSTPVDANINPHLWINHSILLQTNKICSLGAKKWESHVTTKVAI